MESELNIDDKKQYECEICKRNFKAKWLLERHMKNKNECSTKINESFNCYKCGKSFNKKDHLDRHLKKKTPCIENSIFEKSSFLSV